MKTRWLWLSALIICGVALWWLFTRVMPGLEAKHHQEAIEAWPTLVKSRFRGEPQQVMLAFRRCFRKGDAASEYEALFATAEKTVYPDEGQKEKVKYSWYWDLGYGGEGDANFYVIVGDNPPVIMFADIATIEH